MVKKNKGNKDKENKTILFKAKIEANLLKDVISSISSILDEGIIKADHKGLHFLSTDRAMVCAVGFEIPNTSFDLFEVEKKELPLNITFLDNILRRANSNDKILLNSLNNKLELQIVNKIKRSFKVPLYDLTEEELPIHDLSFKTRVKLDSKILKQAVEDAEVVSDSIIFENSPLGKFLAKANGDMSTSELEFLTEITGKGKSRYPIEYLKKILKGAISEKVELAYGDDYPLRIEFKTDKATIFYILAPRVEQEEESEIEETKMKNKDELEEFREDLDE